MTKIDLFFLERYVIYYLARGRGFPKTAHLNVNGILTKSKLQEVQLLLRSTKIDVLGITESKLTSKISDTELNIDGYNFIRKDRNREDGGGGCLLYYLEDLPISECPIFAPEEDNTKTIWVDVKFHSQHLALAEMYRPPKDLLFFEKLDKQLQHVTTRRKNILIMGDLNSDMSPTFLKKLIVEGN